MTERTDFPVWADLRLAVVSPFLDRSHGMERCVVEQIERLAQKYGWEIHLYCQHVEQVAGVHTHSAAAEPLPGETRILGHKISDVPGPHVVKCIWWFAANHFRRWRDRWSGRVKPDLVYSPGINCLDADAIVVHIVFHEFYRRVKGELRLGGMPSRAWPRTLHRKLYYHLIMKPERLIYRNTRVRLAAVSRLAAQQLATHFQRTDVAVIPNAVNTGEIHPSTRERRRAPARERFGFAGEDLVLFLIGNDWKKKGLDCLLEAVAACGDLPLKLLVVGRDDRSPYLSRMAQRGLASRVIFANPSPDVLPFYAAADVYTGPSLEDSFGLPVLEAMTCGLPVTSSAQSGVSEIITDGIDGFILADPIDSFVLTRLIQLLYDKAELRHRMGEVAAQTAQQHTWDRNAEDTSAFLLLALRNKNTK
jgi:glycosyltransferase involved in cell wall biosynthesis